MKIEIDPINDGWLGLTENDLQGLRNPLFFEHVEEDENPYLNILRLMRNPRYIGWTTQVLLNIELLPDQIVILRELWNRPFPMYIAARGWGKALRKNELVRSQGGWKEIQNIQVGDLVYGSDGTLTTVLGITEKQTDLNFYRISLRDGRTIDCCEDHQWKVWDKHKNREYKEEAVWSVLKTKDMLDGFSIKRTGAKSNGTECRYALPINQPLMNEDEKNLLIHPYVVGVLLGDGSITHKTITISSNDQDLINRVDSLLPSEYTIKKTATSNDYIIVTKNGKGKAFYRLLDEIGIFGLNSHNKFIPLDYQYGSYWQRLELIRGLMDTDGYADKSVIEYYTISDQLSDDFLNIARSLGLHCKHSIKQSHFNGKRYKDCNRIRLYTKVPIFALSRKLNAYIHHSISKQGQSKYDKVFITNIEYIGKEDGYCLMVDNADSTYLTKDYIVTHNSFLLGVYATLKGLLYPGTKIVICGAAFRQSKVIFEYMEAIWRDAPVMRSLCSATSGPRRDVDRCTMKLNDSTAIAIPIGDGQKIRGLRANIIIADEFNSIPTEIYETVIAGFAAVSQDPIQNVKEAAKRRAMQDAGLWHDTHEEAYLERRRNQAILSGTCGYTFEHFYDYWKRYRGIIESQGDLRKLEQLLGEDADEFIQNVDWRDFSIIRIPFELVPEGFMDEKQVMRAKATMHAGIYDMEYGACFASDSQGFFKRSLIESIVAREENINKETWPKWCQLPFDPKTRGNDIYDYVIGIDPASEEDNFALVIIEIHPEHQRVVHTWTTNRKDFKERQKAGLTDITDYYAYCVRKIRDLMRVFKVVRIGIDTQGGGHQITEGLHDESKMQEGEIPIWEVVDDDKEKDTDRMPGLHIIEKCNFAKADWTAEANHGLRKDMEDKLLLLPRFDSATLVLAETYDRENFDKIRSAVGESSALKLYDTLEDCVLEIEELKDELSTIVMTQTGIVGRDRWDTPEVKMPGGKKGRLRKDRYSALVIANMLARQIHRALPEPEYSIIGRAAKDVYKDNKNSFMGQLYIGNEWAANINEAVCFGIRRK